MGRAIERADQRLTELRLRIDTAPQSYPGWLTDRDWWVGEVDRLSAELTRLLGDGEGKENE